MYKKIILGVVGVLAGVLVVWGTTLLRPYSLKGSEINPPGPAAQIDLARADGSTYDSKQQPDKIQVVFFGYTYCPDICPTTLANFKQVKADLGKAADQVNFVFISVDPQRDTPQRIQNFVDSFDPAFIGLSGSEADLTPVWNGYGVYHEIDTSQSTTNYTVNHSTQTYLIDLHGNLRLTYAYGTPAADMADDIRHLLKEK
jgi:protein SCO1/2